MANPKEKSKTRKGLFGRTITVTKKKDELGQTSKQRTVTRDTRKGTKTKTTSRSTNQFGDRTKKKNREFTSHEGVTYGYEKRSRNFAGEPIGFLGGFHEKEKTGYMMDKNVASDKNSIIGKSYTKKRDRNKPLNSGGYGKSSRERNIELRDKGPYLSKDSKSISNYKANQKIREAKKLSRGRGSYDK
jgi:hypothetical protein